MKKTTNEVILLQEDYELLTAYFKASRTMQVNERQNFQNLNKELSKAVIMDKESFPDDVVRLNSTVILKDIDTDRIMSLTLVLLEQANIRQGKVSVLAPIGTALIGFRKGRQFTWEVPAGKKNLLIMDVYNAHPLKSN